MNKKKLSSGFSLMEVLVFSAILSMFFVAAVSVVSYMIRISKVSEHKIIATRYAQELFAWLDSDRDIDWNSFSNHSDPPTTYCINTSTLEDTPGFWNTGACSYGLDSFYKRSVKLTAVKTSGFISEVIVNIKVEWREAGKVYNVPIDSTFTVWEQ